MEELLLSFQLENYTTDEAYDKAIKDHISNIDNLFKDKASAIVAVAQQLLEIINPATHSISCLAILNTLKHTDEDAFSMSADALREYIARFLLSYDSRQIRYVGDVFYDLVKDVLECKFFPAHQSIEIAVAALRRLDPDSAMLTSLHIIVVKLAYETTNWDEILPIIERPWVFLPGMKDQSRAKYLCDLTASPAAYINTFTQLTDYLTREAVIEHEYICAMVFMAKQKWAHAHNAYQRIVTWPSKESSVNKLMTDSHKRWILTSLLAFGQAPTPTSHISPTAQKSYAALSKPYMDVATLFSTTNVEQLKAEIEKEAETWLTDQTATLVNEVVLAYPKWQILSLADAYHKISIPEIRQHTFSAETARNLETDGEVEELLQEMFNIGMLQGSLETSPDGIKCLTFHPSDKEIEYTEYQKRIKYDARIKMLNKLIQASDVRLTASKDYAKHMLREQKRQDKDGNQSQNIELGFDASIEDEDLMSGLRQD